MPWETSWWGTVTDESGCGPDNRLNRIVVHDPRWLEVPPVGTVVKVVVLYRSPYWALVEDE